MPNYCDYEMKVKGKANHITEFINVIKADYHIDENGNCDCDRHFWRVFDASVCENNVEEGYAIIGGYCAWSVYSCMCDGPSTYNGDHKDDNAGGTTLQTESERLGLTIEVFSSEPGVGFMEHMVFDNGDCLIQDCIDYAEYYTGEFKTVEEMNEEYGTHFTQKEFESGDYIKVGGLEWDYDNY